MSRSDRASTQASREGVFLAFSVLASCELGMTGHHLGPCTHKGSAQVRTAAQQREDSWAADDFTGQCFRISLGSYVKKQRDVYLTRTTVVWVSEPYGHIYVLTNTIPRLGGRRTMSQKMGRKKDFVSTFVARGSRVQSINEYECPKEACIMVTGGLG